MHKTDLFIITPKNKFLDLKIKEIWQYRDLLVLFIKRDITVTYKQTILGPLWFIIQPIMTTLMFLLVFGNMAGISTGGVPPILFYLGGITIWNYFADSLRLTSDTFVRNAYIFGKIYFPRVVSPLSVVASNLVKFGIQFLLFLGFYFYYLVVDPNIHPNITLLLVPFYIFILAIMSLSFGLIISAMTTKYRDFTFLVQFGVQLWMYATPIIYPISEIPSKYQEIIMINPVSSLVEGFKYAFTGFGTFSSGLLIYSSTFTLFLFVIGLVIFNRTEKTFMDTV